MSSNDGPRTEGADWQIIVILMLTGLIFSMLLLTTPAQSDTPSHQDIRKNVEYKVIPVNKAYLTKMDVNHTIQEFKNKENVVQFYSKFTRSEKIAKTIIQESLRHQVPVHIAISLAWKESRFTPNAVGRPNKMGTRDWGLFQLNDGHRSDWTREEFFNIEKNTRHALSYLSYCVKEMGNLKLGLAAYNAGIHGVRSQGVPASTQQYIKEIFVYESILDLALNQFVEQTTDSTSGS